MNRNMRVSSQNASQKTAKVRAPQRQRGKERVAALLAAGAEVFTEKGYDAATMTEIAARAGASIGSLYQFFPTKELLAAALHAEYLEDLSKALEALRQEAKAKSAGARMDGLFQMLSGFLVDHPAFMVLAERRDIDKERKRATRTLLRGQIAHLLSEASPPVTSRRAEVMAVIVLQLMKAVVALGGEEDKRLRDAVVTELRQMLKGHLEAR